MGDDRNGLSVDNGHASSSMLFMMCDRFVEQETPTYLGLANNLCSGRS